MFRCDQKHISRWTGSPRSEPRGATPRDPPAGLVVRAAQPLRLCWPRGATPRDPPAGLVVRAAQPLRIMVGWRFAGSGSRAQLAGGGERAESGVDKVVSGY